MNDNSIFRTQRYFIFISICFSTIKHCNYWNYQTENAIVEHAIELFDEIPNQTHLSTDLPETIRICNSTIKVTYASTHEGALCFSSEVSKAALAELIFANTAHNTGFLIRLGNLALACITENNMSFEKENQRTKYFIVSLDETCDIHDQMDPTGKQILLENLHLKYKEMDPISKQFLLENLHLKYKEMEPLKKDIFLEKRGMVYNAMDFSEKEVYCAKNRTNMKRKSEAKKTEKQNKKIKSSSDDVMFGLLYIKVSQ